MKLISKKIYRAYNYSSGTPLPTLEIQGTPKIYVSLAEDMPKLEKMTDVTSEVKEGINLLSGQIRWIAAVYTPEDDESGQTVNDAVYECGIVTNNVQGR